MLFCLLYQWSSISLLGIIPYPRLDVKRIFGTHFVATEGTEGE